MTNKSTPAVGFMEKGPPEVLGLVEIAREQPGPGEIIVQSRAFTVNPTDTMFRSGQNRAASTGEIPPFVPGMEFAGEVIDANAARWSVGDKVFGVVVPGSVPGKNAYAQNIVVNEAAVTEIPPNTTIASAATIPMNGLTALQVLDIISLNPGESIAVTGAAGALGAYVVQLAKSRSLRVVVDASPADRGLMEGLGADHIVERGANMADQVREYFPAGVNALIDAAMIGEAAVPAIADGGRYVCVRWMDWAPPRGITAHTVLVYDYIRDLEKLPARLQNLRSAVEQGDLTLRVADIYRPEDTALAHARLEQGGVRGRLVVEWPED